MSEKLKSLLFVSLDTTRVGLEKEELPLHVTITPPFFKVDQDQNEALDKRLRRALEPIKTFRLTGQEDAEYGPDENIPVRKIGGSVLYIVHDIVLPIAKQFDRGIDTTYAGDNYSPHSTYKGNRNIQSEERREVKSLFLAQKTNIDASSNWRILEEYRLKESNANWQ